MPLAIVGDASIGQSAAINYYLATECGLMGKSSLEAAQIISISEHLKEMNTAYRTIVPWGAEPSKDALDKWFDQGATDVTGTADRAGQSTRYLTWWMGRIEAVLGSSGFAVGDSLSLADVLLYNVFSEHLKVIYDDYDDFYMLFLTCSHHQWHRMHNITRCYVLI